MQMSMAGFSLTSKLFKKILVSLECEGRYVANPGHHPAVFTDINCPIGCYESFLVRNLILAPALSLTSFSTSCRRKTIAKKKKKNWDHSSFETPAVEITVVILGTCNAFSLDWNLFACCEHLLSFSSTCVAGVCPG